MAPAVPGHHAITGDTSPEEGASRGRGSGWGGRSGPLDQPGRGETGKAGLETAISAFNEGVIDCFLQKQDANVSIALRREIKRALRSGSPVSLLFLDLDGFKDVNDSLGHMAGDRLLGAVGRRLAESTGPDDTVARLDIPVASALRVRASGVRDGTSTAVGRCR